MQSAELKKHNSLFYAERLISDRPHGLKLIEFEKGRLATSTEGSRLLKSLPATHPTNLVFIFGNARSGKSFMMNCLVGVKGLFQVINSATPCTRGVDISSYTVKQEVLASSVQSHHMAEGIEEDEAFAEPDTPGKSPIVGFVDVEGQGAEDGTYDTMLALPLLLTSRVVLFNHKGAPTVSDMLSKLGVLARAAEYIDLEEDDVDESGERKSVSRKATLTRTPSLDNGTPTNKKTGKKKFGHLHVLFRDFSFTGDVENVRDQLMGKEALPKESKKPKSLKDGPASSHLDVARAIQERNDIRSLLESNFESINVHLFRQPADPDALKAHAELPASLVDDEFISSVHHLLALITKQLAKPTTFNGTILTGPRLQTLISQVTTALNENGLINVPSVYRAMETETVNRVATELLADFDREIQKIKSNLPMSSAKLDGLIAALVRLLQARFDEDLQECRLEPEKIKKKDELKLAGDKARSELTVINTTATYKRAREVVSKHFSQCKLDFDVYVNENIPMEDVKILDDKFSMLKKQAEMNIERDLIELPECLKSNEYRILLIEAQESLTEFLHLKSIQNQNAIKEKQIQKLRDDAIKQQQMLIEQNRRLEQYITDEKKTTQDLERELEMLKKQKEDAEKNNIEAKARLDAQIKELERLRKAKKCVIL